MQGGEFTAAPGDARPPPVDALSCLTFNMSRGGKLAVETLLGFLKGRGWAVCCLQEVGTTDLAMPGCLSAPAVTKTFDDQFALLVHKCDTWRGLGILLNLHVVQPVATWASPWILTVLLKSS